MKKELVKHLVFSKDTTTVEYRTTVYAIGIYIDTYISGNLHNRTTRNSVTKVNNFLSSEAKRLADLGWTQVKREVTTIIENQNKLPIFQEI